MVREEEATGRVGDIYEGIKSKPGIDFVPNMYNVMAPDPDFQEANWNKINTAVNRPGKLATLT